MINYSNLEKSTVKELRAECKKHGFTLSKNLRNSK